MYLGPYLIVRHAQDGTSHDYVAHGETPYDLKLGFSWHQPDATRYTAKRDAIRDCNRIAKHFHGYVWQVLPAHTPFGTVKPVHTIFVE